jgi:hypothetical protein
MLQRVEVKCCRCRISKKLKSVLFIYTPPCRARTHVCGVHTPQINMFVQRSAKRECGHYCGVYHTHTPATVYRYRVYLCPCVLPLLLV